MPLTWLKNWALTYHIHSNTHKKHKCSVLYWASESAAKHSWDSNKLTPLSLWLSLSYSLCVALSFSPLSFTPSGCLGDTKQAVQPVYFAWFRTGQEVAADAKRPFHSKEQDTQKGSHTKLKGTHSFTCILAHTLMTWNMWLSKTHRDAMQWRWMVSLTGFAHCKKILCWGV